MTDKAELLLTGPRTGPPTIDDLVALFEALHKRKATAEEIAIIRAEIEAGETGPNTTE